MKKDDDIKISADYRIGAKVHVVGSRVNPVGPTVNPGGPPIVFANASSNTPLSDEDPDAEPTGVVTPLELAAVEVWAKDSKFFVLKHSVPRIAAEFRSMRALLADLAAEGCPTGEDGRCVYCDGPYVGDEPSGEPKHRHSQKMEDGQSCLWLRIEAAR